MGRRTDENENTDWIEAQDEQGPIDLDEDLETADDDGDDDVPVRASRPTGAQRLLARRLIEQAREQSELSKRLADFEDYVV